MRTSAGACLLLLLQGVVRARREELPPPSIVRTKPVSVFYLAAGSAASVEAINSSSQPFAIDCTAPGHTMKTFMLYAESDLRPGVRVAHCSAADTTAVDAGKSAHASSSRGDVERRDLAICLPALHAPHRSFPAKGWRHVQSWLERFVTFYTGHGVSRFYMYTMGEKTVPIDIAAAHSGKAAITWIDTSWVSSFWKTSQKVIGKRAEDYDSVPATVTRGLWYNGQVWSMNDCLYRNKRLLDGSSHRYVFFTDYDEIFGSTHRSSNLKTFLFSSEYMHGLTRQGSASRSNEWKLPPQIDFDSVTFGQYISYSFPCDGGEAAGGAIEDWALSDSCKRAKKTYPECIRSGLQKNRTALEEGRFTCGTWRGRRKHVDNVRTVFLTTVHSAKECPYHRLNCAVYGVDARQAWLNHYRTAVFNASSQQCVCQERQAKNVA